MHSKLDELGELVEQARAMPMSTSCLVNRSDVLALVDEVRALLPAELEHADHVLADRDFVVADGHAQAERLIAEARAQVEAIVEQSAVVLAAQDRARQILSEATVEADRMLTDADDYCDRKLAEFEIDLDKLRGQVSAGRERLRRRQQAAVDLAEAQREAAEQGPGVPLPEDQAGGEGAHQPTSSGQIGTGQAGPVS